MTDTPQLGLPLVAAAQAQKHVTVNEALHALDALVHLAVLDRDLATPPAGPREGDRYIVAAPGIGAWAGRAGEVAAWTDGAWRFHTPRRGWLAYAIDEGALLVFDGEAWSAGPLGVLSHLARLGIGTAADPQNPFSARLNAALWAARPAGEGGTGDLRVAFSKEAPGRVLSHLWQTAFGARAETGLIGSDDFVVKVSPDGSAWREALRLDRTTGTAHFPQGVAVGPGCGGRLSLKAGEPVTASDVAGAAAIHLVHATGDAVPVFDGSDIAWRRFPELALALGPAHLAATLYDVFLFEEGGALRLGTGPAWASALSRGEGPGSAELERRGAIHVNRFAASLRDGTDLRPVAAGRATYLGTFRTAAAGRTEDQGGGQNAPAGRLLWNAFNRRPRPMRTAEAATSWPYTSPAWRRANANPNLELRFVVGLAEDEVRASGAMGCTATSTPANGIGYDWTSGPPDARGLWSFGAAGGAYGTVCPSLALVPAPGFHVLVPLELGNAGATFFGTAPGGQWCCGLSATVWA